MCKRKKKKNIWVFLLKWNNIFLKSRISNQKIIIFKSSDYEIFFNILSFWIFEREVELLKKMLYRKKR